MLNLGVAQVNENDLVKLVMGNNLVFLSKGHNMTCFNCYKDHCGEELTRKVRAETRKLVR